jgi:hypothetical protein
MGNCVRRLLELDVTDLVSYYHMYNVLKFKAIVLPFLCRPELYLSFLNRLSVSGALMV